MKKKKSDVFCYTETTRKDCLSFKLLVVTLLLSLLWNSQLIFIYCILTVMTF
jgi:hypothetical protein